MSQIAKSGLKRVPFVFDIREKQLLYLLHSFTADHLHAKMLPLHRPMCGSRTPCGNHPNVVLIIVNPKNGFV